MKKWIAIIKKKEYNIKIIHSWLDNQVGKKYAETGGNCRLQKLISI